VRTATASLEVATAYPHHGLVRVTVTATGDAPWTLSLRVPGWCRGATATVDGQPVPVTTDRGYLPIARRWQVGDVVEFAMPMPVRLTVAHPSVDALRGAVAIERGPVVYCLESPDQAADVDLNRVELLAGEPLREQVRKDFLGGPAVLVTAAAVLRDDSAWSGSGWRSLGERPPANGRRVTLTAIPYHLWANRGPSVMRIFVPVR
jgi:DUF1680 family protein